MNRTIALAAAAVLAVTLSACAGGPHTNASMLSGSHVMPGQKAGVMSDRVMPSRSADCTDEALAKMPVEHHAICERARASTSN